MYKKPLIYMGNKGYISRLIQPFIKSDTVYVEPFAGAFTCGLGINCDRKIYNDLSEPVYMFWCCVKEDYRVLIKRIDELIKSCLDIEKLKVSLQSFDKFERAAAFWILNRSSMGCIDSVGKGKMSYTYYNYNYEALYNMLYDSHKLLENTELYNKTYTEIRYDNAFYLIDPPYYNMDNVRFYGEHCRSFSHQALYDYIDNLKAQWVLTYDNAPEISSLYSKYFVAPNIVYSKLMGIYNKELIITNNIEIAKVFEKRFIEMRTLVDRQVI